MELNQARKCENCGGSLEAVDADTLKCAYCGCTYSRKSMEQPAAQASAPADRPAADTGSGGGNPGGNSSGAKIFLILFLVLVVIVIVAVVFNAAHPDKPVYSDHVDSLLTDTNANGTLNILSDDEQKEAKEPHVKKTFPDPEIAITKHRIGMADGAKEITLYYRNNSKHDILHADFTIQLFDAQGHEIAVPDSEKTIKIYGRTSPGESQGDRWSRGPELTHAKTVKVTLKKVALDSVVWDY